MYTQKEGNGKTEAEIRVMNGVTTKEHPGLPRVNQMLVKVRKTSREPLEKVWPS